MHPKEPTKPVLARTAHPAMHPDNVQEMSEPNTRIHLKRPAGLIGCRHRYIKVYICDLDRKLLP